MAVFLFEPLHDAVRNLPWVARGMITSDRHLVSRIRRRMDIEAKSGRLSLGLHDLPSSPEDKLGLSSYLVRLRLNPRIRAR